MSCLKRLQAEAESILKDGAENPQNLTPTGFYLSWYYFIFQQYPTPDSVVHFEDECQFYNLLLRVNNPSHDFNIKLHAVAETNLQNRVRSPYLRLCS
jgi:hypothetical protein